MFFSDVGVFRFFPTMTIMSHAVLSSNVAHVDVGLATRCQVQRRVWKAERRSDGCGRAEGLEQAAWPTVDPAVQPGS